MTRIVFLGIRFFRVYPRPKGFQFTIRNQE